MQTYVLLQANLPSPVKPLLQIQLNESGRLTQVALWWHWAIPNLHSSISGHAEYDHTVLQKENNTQIFKTIKQQHSYTEVLTGKVCLNAHTSGLRQQSINIKS